MAHFVKICLGQNTRTLYLIVNLRVLILGTVLVTCPVSSPVADTVYLKPAEALRLIFHSSKEIIQEKKALSLGQKADLEKTLGEELRRETWNFYKALSGSKIEGYALIDNEIGKMEPITFMTAISPEGKILAVEVLVYRESHGSEVSHKSFVKQYRQKGLEDPLGVGQDIRNVTGATLSARAVTRGVRRALRLWDIFYGK